MIDTSARETPAASATSRMVGGAGRLGAGPSVPEPVTRFRSSQAVTKSYSWNAATSGTHRVATKVVCAGWASYAA